MNNTNHRASASSLRSLQNEDIRTPARAKYDFSAQNDNEYSLKRGQSIVVTKLVDDNWCHVETVNGAKGGIVPMAYIEMIGSSASQKPRSSGKARAKYDYEASTDKEMSFEKDDEMILLEKIDDSWYKGKVGDKIGIVPAVYIEVETEPEREIKKGSTGTLSFSRSSRPSSQNTSSQSLASAHSLQSTEDEDDGEKEKKQRAAFLANSVVGSMSSLQTKKRRAHLEDLIDEAEKVEFARLEKEHLNNFPSPKDKNGLGLIPKVSIPRPNNCGLKLAVLDQPTTKYLVLYDYEASNNDELNLVKGDLINVVEACEDGWCVGTCERTGLFGTFPGNYAVTKKSESVDL